MNDIMFELMTDEQKLDCLRSQATAEEKAFAVSLMKINHNTVDIPNDIKLSPQDTALNVFYYRQVLDLRKSKQDFIGGLINTPNYVQTKLNKKEYASNHFNLNTILDFISICIDVVQLQEYSKQLEVVSNVLTAVKALNTLKKNLSGEKSSYPYSTSAIEDNIGVAIDVLFAIQGLYETDEKVKQKFIKVKLGMKFIWKFFNLNLKIYDKYTK